jgi:Co/Zn/Cd efflux system component
MLAIVALTSGKFFGWTWLDPVVGIVGSAVVFSWAYSLLRDTSGILLDRTPASSDLHGEIRKAIESDGAHEPKSCESYRARLCEHEELVHVTIETHTCSEPHTFSVPAISRG